MWLIIRTSALIVTSSITLTELVLAARINGGWHAWGTTALLLTIVALVLGIASVALEWQAAAARAHKSPTAREPDVPGWTRLPPLPLVPFHLRFTLRHTTSTDMLARAFPAMRDTHDSLAPEALADWIERYSGFGEWPIKKPIEMFLEIRPCTAQATGGDDLLRFQLCVFDDDVHVTGVRRVDDVLFQDNTICKWETRTQSTRVWTLADLEGARLRIRAAYLSFDDVNVLRPPRFHHLQLHFGAHVISLDEDQLSTPVLQQDPRPLVHGPFFKTLVLEYGLTMTKALLVAQLSHPMEQR